MPLTKSGDDVMANMQEEYGDEKGKEVFYASISKGKNGSEKWHKGGKKKRRGMGKGLRPMEGMHREDGGPVKKGEKYIVGEAGPETFIPAQSGRIRPYSAFAEDSKAMSEELRRGSDTPTAMANKRLRKTY